jgi:farnesyl diphosphate synthase
MTLADDLAASATAIETFLDGYLADMPESPLLGTPERLLAAMRHGSLAGGKRLRPFLLRTVAGLFGLDPAAAVRAGAALEMVHCYSLIHDDLPDMDNDTLRRGRPTVWAAYDPATAILAGDALLTEAFRLLADPETHPDAGIRLQLVQSLSNAAGPIGMVGGQMLDIEGEGEAMALEDVYAMQQMKTGALIGAAMEMGAILAGAGAGEVNRMTLCAFHAGLAFQIADDILDATASTQVLGKTAGKDQAQEKSTVVALKGLDGARALLDAAIADALGALADHGPEADRLREVIGYFASRPA